MNRIYCARFKRGAVYAPFSRQSLARAAGSTQLEKEVSSILLFYISREPYLLALPKHWRMFTPFIPRKRKKGPNRVHLVMSFLYYTHVIIRFRGEYMAIP